MSDLNFFHKIFLLQEMDAAEVQEVLKIATPRLYPVGAVIIHEGEALEHSIRLSLVTRARCSSLSVRAWRAARTLGSATALAKPNPYLNNRNEKDKPGDPYSKRERCSVNPGSARARSHETNRVASLSYRIWQ